MQARHAGRAARRRNWREADARAALADQRRSGLSAAEFAVSRGIPASRLAWWAKRLGGTDSTVAPNPSATKRDVGLALRLLPAVAIGSDDREAVVVVRAAGVEIEVRDTREVAAPWVAELVGELTRSRP